MLRCALSTWKTTPQTVLTAPKASNVVDQRPCRYGVLAARPVTDCGHRESADAAARCLSSGAQGFVRRGAAAVQACCRRRWRPGSLCTSRAGDVSPDAGERAQAICGFALDDGAAFSCYSPTPKSSILPGFQAFPAAWPREPHLPGWVRRINKESGSLFVRAFFVRVLGPHESVCCIGGYPGDARGRALWRRRRFGKNMVAMLCGDTHHPHRRRSHVRTSRLFLGRNERTSAGLRATRQDIMNG